MRERPILFSAPMIRAILGGRKTQTRRIVKPQPELREIEQVGHMLGFKKRHGDGFWLWPNAHDRIVAECPHGQAGDRLWVKHAAHLLPVYFKPIVGWDGPYSAGTDGVIYRMDRGEPQPLAPSPNSKGYSTVSLSRGAWETHTVHRLVCEAFYGPPPIPHAQVRHLDGNRANNVPDNLDWGTHADNWQDRKGHGGGMGEAHHAAKLDASAIAEIRTSALSQRALARKFGVSQATVSDARRGKTWREHQCGERNMKAFSLWKSSIHMPRWASRITLEITGVRVERLQDVSEADAIAEGVDRFPGCRIDDDTAAFNRIGPVDNDSFPIARYAVLWESINGPESWAANPFVWVVEFKRVEQR